PKPLRCKLPHRLALRASRLSPASGGEEWCPLLQAEGVPRSFGPSRSLPLRPLALRGGGPEVDVRLAGIDVDFRKLLVGEIKPAQAPHDLLHLFRPAGADQGGGHPPAAQHPSHRHLSQGLAATLCDLVEGADVLQRVLVEKLLPQRLALRGAAILRDAAEILVG